MRRVLAIGCCLLWLGYGSLAGIAHIHQSAADHHVSMGLHLDHTHVDEAADHDHADSSLSPDICPEHADHHGHNIAYINDGAVRLADNERLLPALVAGAPVVEDDASGVDLIFTGPTKPRDPPKKLLPPLRAPPV